MSLTNSGCLEPDLSIKFNVPIIREVPFNLQRDYCKTIIERFEEDDKKYEGVFGSNTVNKNIKNSTDLGLTEPHWQDVAELLYQKLYDTCDGWMREHHLMINLPFPNGRVVYSPIQIQRTLPGKVGYVWHSDNKIFWNKQPGDEKHLLMRRYITFLWYLNDNDGYTEFRGRKVMPEAGKLLLFFADPSVIHRGIPPTEGKKYIATGWISTQCAGGQLDELEEILEDKRKLEDQN